MKKKNSDVKFGFQLLLLLFLMFLLNPVCSTKGAIKSLLNVKARRPQELEEKPLTGPYFLVLYTYLRTLI